MGVAPFGLHVLCRLHALVDSEVLPKIPKLKLKSPSNSIRGTRGQRGGGTIVVESGLCPCLRPTLDWQPADGSLVEKGPVPNRFAFPVDFSSTVPDFTSNL